MQLRRLGGLPHARGHSLRTQGWRPDVHYRHLHALSSAEIRSKFLGFFEQNGHTIVPSASLAPPDADGSLLFTNAGMVPFKQLFLGNEQRPYVRATSAQRCVRAGGKHNDLDQVGLTRRHHTLFEMLGNFSFGDYFKEDAIAFSWQFLTRELHLPADRLHVTVLDSDDEARRLWKQVAGLKDSQIISYDESENFWAMGDSGPCGPCSEIFWDLGDHLTDPDERYLELWNLVFMQFNRNEGDLSGKLYPLPKCSVDTGMGLERVASVLQGVPSNYHTDLFVPLMHNVAQVLDAHCKTAHTQELNLRSFSNELELELNPQNYRWGTTERIQTIRIVADHLKASYAMLHDGIFPSNIGRGYVLRRIIRRAIRHAQKCGVSGDFLSKIAIPEWEHTSGWPQMRAIIANEEKAFEEMLQNGKKAIEKVFTKAELESSNSIAGDSAFRLYDTYGIPLDITQVLAEERGLIVDTEGFQSSLEQHRRLASESSSFTSNLSDSSSAAAGTMGDTISRFVGYDKLDVEGAHVLSTWGEPSKESFWVSIDPCPFYAEGGGQVGDHGHLIVALEDQSPFELQVLDTKRIGADGIALQCSYDGEMSTESVLSHLKNKATRVDAQVDRISRAGCQVHHSATHLLQRALKEVLGDHITQAGSFVGPNRLRFDFAHFGALSLDEMTRVETFVNDQATKALPVKTLELPRADAEASGAICNFGEKYGDIVRVVSIGSMSNEFCGGTHVENTSSVFPFVLLSEGSVAAGTRRIEAVAGMEGAKHLQLKDKTLQQLATQLETTPAKVPERITKMQKQIKQQESALQALGDVIATLPAAPIACGAAGTDASNVHVHVLECPAGSSSSWAAVLKRRAQFLHQDGPKDAVHVVLMGTQVICVGDGKQAHAGKLLQKFLKPLGGRGGGSALMAQGSLPAAPDSPSAFAHHILQQQKP